MLFTSFALAGKCKFYWDFSLRIRLNYILFRCSRELRVKTSDLTEQHTSIFVENSCKVHPHCVFSFVYDTDFILCECVSVCFAFCRYATKPSCELNLQFQTLPVGGAVDQRGSESVFVCDLGIS